jgi:hypothetical protein
MTSGIYKLTFTSGKYYVGKSIDLETRWKQHFNKFATGKAARPMQLEYDRCGLPKTEMIFSCHKEHIDILEEWLIDQLKGPDMLNTTYPEVARTSGIANLINSSKELLKLSTWQHLEIIHKNIKTLSEAEDAVDEVEFRLRKYKTSGYIIDDDYNEMVDLAQKYSDANDILEEQLNDANQKLESLKNLSWFNRLFNYKVYV